MLCHPEGSCEPWSPQNNSTQVQPMKTTRNHPTAVATQPSHQPCTSPQTPALGTTCHDLTVVATQGQPPHHIPPSHSRAQFRERPPVAGSQQPCHWQPTYAILQQKCIVL